MDVLLMLGAVWTVYGLLGLAGWQVIPEKCRRRPWTGRYVRRLGLSWLMMGLPWIGLWALLRGTALPWPAQWAAVVLVSLPALVYTWALERRYKKRPRRPPRAGGA